MDIRTKQLMNYYGTTKKGSPKSILRPLSIMIVLTAYLINLIQGF